MVEAMKSEYNALVAAFLIIVLFGGSLASCFWPSGNQDEEYTVTGTVTGLSSYNQPMLDIRADDLFAHGMELGSTFTIETEERTYQDAILLTGYLGMFMFDMFVNVESNGYISIGCIGKLVTADEGSKVTLTHTGTSERYLSTPLYNGDYTNSRADYASDAEFANFYEVTGGDIKPGILYRSFSPLYAPEMLARSAYVNQLAEEHDIQFEIALSYSNSTVTDATKKVQGYCVDLCKEGKYIAPSMGYLYFQQKEKTKDVLTSILDNDGAYLIHCNIGRDRTGFTVLLIQALCGCTEQEMQECEARAFCNLYHIEVGSEEYKTVVDCTYDRNMYLIAHPEKIDDIFDIDWDNINVDGIDTYAAAYDFCTKYLGLTDAQVQGIQDKLCN
jgi:hypothetical protein